jgi:hypothetical protein
MKTKIELGNSVKSPLFRSINESVDSSVWVLVRGLVDSPVRDSINDLIRWDIEL